MALERWIELRHVDTRRGQGINKGINVTFTVFEPIKFMKMFW